MATVTFQGNVLHLEGTMPKIGEPAPAFQLAATDLNILTNKDFIGKVLVLATVPSLDTPVCDLEGRHFNQEAAQLSPEKLQIAMVSRDLPFAQVRWADAAKPTRVLTLSDYRDGAFGRAYGVMIEELKLLARAVFVINEKGVLVYSQLVPEVTNPPAYAPVLEAVKKALANG